MSAVAQCQRTIVDTHVTTKVSQELMQTMLSASFGCISYLRGIFPDDTFTEERYNASNLKGQKTSLRGNGQRLMRLKRNVAPEATKLLDYLEHGIFDALSNGYLSSVILSISLDKMDENNVHEAYTFQFSYNHGQSPSLTIKDQIRRTATTGLPLDSAKRSMQQLFRQLITLTQSLSPLPDDLDKIIAIRLFYNDRVPDDYEPPGFRAALASESARFVTRSADDVPHDQQVGSLATGHHACVLKVTTLDEFTDTTRDAFSTLKLWDAEHNAKSVCSASVTHTTNLESSYDATMLLQQSGEEHNLMSRPDNSIQESIRTEFESTQILGSDNPTSLPAPSGPHRESAYREDRNEGKRNTRSSVRMGLRNRDVGTGDDILSQLNQNACQKSDQTSTKNQQACARSDAMDKTRRNGPASSDDRVSCECGDPLDEGIMVQCDQCHGWSHVPCYGHLDSVLEKGHVHICSTCSCRGTEELENFRSLAIMRRALHAIWEDGFTFNSTRAFGQSIGVKDINTANNLLQRLVSEGWIRQNKTISLSTRKSAKASRNKPTHEVIRTPDNSTRLLTHYFNPRKNTSLLQSSRIGSDAAETPGTADRSGNSKDGVLVKNSITDINSNPIAPASACASSRNNEKTISSNVVSSDVNLPSTEKAPMKRKRASPTRPSDQPVNRVEATPDIRNTVSDDDEDTTDEMDVDLSVGNSMTKREAVIVPARRSSARIKRLKVSISSKSIVAPGLDAMEA